MMSDDKVAGEYRGLEGTRPFAGAGWYYAEYRDRVSPAFIARLAVRLDWRAKHRILDLGAGPAQLSLLVAPLVAEVVAIEPEPDMLGEGERRVRAAQAGNIRFVCASSDDLPRLSFAPGMFRAALMGASFHWMLDKDQVLRDLGALLDPVESAVVFIWYDRVMVPAPLSEARARMHDILERYLTDVPPGPHPRGRHDPFEAILARSPFPHVEKLEYVYDKPVRPTFEALVGAEYSMSHTLTRLGDRRARFEDDVRAALADLGDLGELTVTMCDHALIGSR